MSNLRILIISLALGVAVHALPAAAANLAFGNSRETSDLPVQVEADQLDVNQKDGTATFSGNVLISQGEMLLSAPTVLVVYAEDNKKIIRLTASGGVTVANGADAAEAQNADYDIDAGTVLLTGNVLVTQGQNVMSGDRVVLNLDAGTAVAGGRVRTTLETKE